LTAARDLADLQEPVEERAAFFDEASDVQPDSSHC
jgi:hypothetical protein